MEITIKPIKLTIIITDRSRAKKVTKVLNSHGYDYQFATTAKGTAPSDIQAYFGLNEPEKSIVFCPINEDRVEELLDVLKKELHFDEPNTGIAFTIPIGSLSSINILKYLNHEC